MTRFLLDANIISHAIKPSPAASVPRATDHPLASAKRLKDEGSNPLEPAPRAHASFGPITAVPGSSKAQ